MKEFSKLIIPKTIMQDGILFVWVEKEYIMDVCKFLENQEFYYVENVCWIMLDETMREGKIYLFTLQRLKKQDYRMPHQLL